MTTTLTEDRRVFISLRVRLLIAFTLLFTLIFAGAYYWFYTFASQSAMNRLGEDLSVLLNGAAAKIDGDEFQALYTEGTPRADGYTDDPRYWKHVGWLATVQGIDPRSALYTYIKGEKPNEVIFVGSSGALADPQFGAKFLERFTPEVHPEAIINGLQRTSLLLEIYTDQWGSWISGYAPIHNAKGDIVGGIGADFRADYVLQVQKAIRDQIFVSLVITYGILFLLVWFIANGLTRPIASLTRIAAKIGEGDYNQDLSGLGHGRVRDEIGTLASVFRIMVDKVYQREQTLRLQVEELKIVIDESKRQKEVNEIVESDFFRGLQAKARTMRARNVSGEGIE
jgi:HAMP domain-containing protein